ncbi:hypothetical protein PR048_020361 [Dryococelus australis]|uniref:Uncharacterized protein n=1 Tax=Dryococelus australis TaxID=614101 RepID=A0ABQ9H620_9NEOP|nr:hypothetical protein PR048_020361 [Dryococelus australis]
MRSEHNEGKKVFRIRRVPYIHGLYPASHLSRIPLESHGSHLKQFLDEHLCEYLQYELSPYTLVLFTDTGMRKTTKSLLYKCFEPTQLKLDTGNITYIIDGGFLLHRVISKCKRYGTALNNRYNFWIYRSTFRQNDGNNNQPRRSSFQQLQ